MFYLYNQNNSGGSFTQNGDLAHRVVIEAPSIGMANDKAEEIGIYFDGVESGYDCACCGDRWHSPDELSDHDKQDMLAYVQGLADRYGWTSPDCIVHYLDGTKGYVYKKQWYHSSRYAAH